MGATALVVIPPPDNMPEETAMGTADEAVAATSPAIAGVSWMVGFMRPSSLSTCEVVAVVGFPLQENLSLLPAPSSLLEDTYWF